MSDYLGNLIARTVSPAVAVRPRLPSLFEPAPATREGKSEPEFEQENFVEQPPVTRPSEKLAPTLSTPMPPQPALWEPARRAPEISRPSKILETSHESEAVPVPAPSVVSRQSIPRESARAVSRREDGKPSLEPEAAVQPRVFPRAAATPREGDPSKSSQRRSDVINPPVREAVALVPASQKVGARKGTGRLRPAVAEKPVVVPEPRGPELPARSEAKPIVPTIRPLPPVAPRPPAAATASPAINVTISRVEIRAVPPPPQQRAKSKPATVLSLEDYLRQRSNGGLR